MLRENFGSTQMLVKITCQTESLLTHKAPGSTWSGIQILHELGNPNGKWNLEQESGYTPYIKWGVGADI